MPRYTFDTEQTLSPEQLKNLAHAGARFIEIPEFEIKPATRTLRIVGRRWFQKTYGNTYHTAEIILDGKTIHKTPISYGYGDQYLTSAVEWLQSVGLLPDNITGHIGTRYLRDESGYEFTYDVQDVPRQRDL